MEISEDNTRATHLLLPAWWVRAYEVTTLSEAAADEGAMQRAESARLAPVMSAVELNALATILAGLQEQVLGGGHRVLRLASDDHLKHASTTVKSRLYAFERMMQQLVGIRILHEAGTSADPALSAAKIFASDRFVAGAIELLPTRLGAELILGFADPHLDLLRMGSGESEGAAVLGPRPPLALWRSAWLELMGLEQVLFLRMERGMQWDFRWLQLDGVFGLPIGELFHGLKLPELKAQTHLLALQKRLRVLDRLGKKLASHGFLTVAASDQYLAVERGEDPALSIVWQVGKERLASDAAHAYRVAVQDFVRVHRYADFGDALHRVFLPPSPGVPALNSARAVWGKLAALAAPREALLNLSFAQSQPVLPHALFYEWLARRGAAGGMPLPERVTTGVLGKLTAPPLPGESLAEGELAERFAHFCDYIAATPDLGTWLGAVPFASLASPLSQASADLRRSVRELLVPSVPGVLLSSDADEKSAAAGNAERAPSGREPTADALLAAKNDPANGRSATLSGALQARLRKIATDELMKMRSSSPERYQDLRKAFFASIDQDQRRTILDCQRTMPSPMFEEHLRHRLVRYMVDNPGGWRSSTGEARFGL